MHQPEEDQQILPNALQQQQHQTQQQQQQQQQVPPLAPMGSLTPTLGLGMGMSLMSQTKSNYGFAPPQSLMQPQTPVSEIKGILCSKKVLIWFFTATKYDFVTNG